MPLQFPMNIHLLKNKSLKKLDHGYKFNKLNYAISEENTKKFCGSRTIPRVILHKNKS